MFSFRTTRSHNANRFHTSLGMSSDKQYKPTTNTKGEFVRKDSQFRNSITADGSSGFKAQANRYHLYVSFACPWAHRTLIVRKLKGLEKVLSVNVVDWLMESKGWTFDTEGNSLNTTFVVYLRLHLLCI